MTGRHSLEFFAATSGPARPGTAQPLMAEPTGLEPTSVVVIGGGIAGLVTAWEVARAGRAVTLFEATSSVGGCIARHRVADLDLDAGAESFAIATRAVLDLIDDLGLSSRVVSPNPAGAWVRHARGSAPLPTDSLLGIPAHPLAGDVRRVLGPIGATRAALDLLLPRRVGGTAATLGGMVTRRMGRTVVKRLVEPVAGGVYSTDPDELELDSAQPALRAAVSRTGSLATAVRRLRATSARPGSAVAGLTGGLYTLVEALRADLERLGGLVLTDTAVRAAAQAADGWRVLVGDDQVGADDVVLAVPGADISRILALVDVDVPPTAAVTNTVRLVTLVVEHPALDAHPRGTGILVSRHASGVAAKALTHATAKWAWLAQAAGPGRHVLRLSYGRGDDDLPSDLVGTALRDASVLLGVDLDRSHLIDSDVIGWTSALPRPQPGHRAAMATLKGQIAQQPGLHLTGSMVDGTGLAAVITGARTAATRLLSVTTQADGPRPADR
ncbi:oxygen-dependent protoporphyrinogen oxidase [Nakamurella panacisegetis]|uniref:Coproporphyrinogen III oxidase n=1 Tax=Nakamurella panacisegetis TaxID=1090615 RepID=A0A1H0HTF7_9ACTN|nr:protoporphyrinogen oxidase [Nakamurella panacisegetis]SDO22418.1 oxygen-dependent protoporphyrinogen oxidase [Nakamurella panacisegetis]